MKKDKNKQLQKAEKKETSIVRSSAAEYLTFVAATGEGGVEAVYADENIWLSQKMMGVLYDVNVRTVNEHLKKIFSDSELQEDSVIRKFRITAADGKSYNTMHYNLSAIIAVGYKVNSERAVQFRRVGYSRLGVVIVGRKTELSYPYAETGNMSPRGTGSCSDRMLCVRNR